MKLTISNVTRNNVNAIKALVRVALNQECTVQQYEVTDSVEALTRAGHEAACDLYWDTSTAGADNPDEANAMRLAALEQAANPYKEQTPQRRGWSNAVRDAKNNDLSWYRPIKRYALTVECEALNDTSLLFRFAHQLGKVCRNCVVSMD